MVMMDNDNDNDNDNDDDKTKNQNNDNIIKQLNHFLDKIIDKSK